jgi:two-component system OmpR family response regulator
MKMAGGEGLKILLIEDDGETADYVMQGLNEEGHNVVVAVDGRDGLFRAAGDAWDLLIVDRMVPGLDGLGLVRTIRGAGIETSVLFLTTLGGIDDRVAGLNAGGDDYLVKPFAFAELVARVSALGRRPRHTAAETLVRVADLEIDLLSRVVRRGGHRIELQPREFRLLEYLMRHAGQVVTRTMLLENVWDFHFDPRTNVVETHISRLRGKLDKDHAAELIHTVRGAGYCLRAPA